MARDGQGARDYGTHLLPEINWKLYDACFSCKAKAGMPCWDKRFRHSVPKPNWQPHRRRALVSVLDGKTVVEKMKES